MLKFQKWILHWAVLLAVAVSTLGVLAMPLQAATRTSILGQSAKEREIKWLWKYLREFVLSCAAQEGECQKPEIKSLLAQIADYAPDWQNSEAWLNGLEFVSEKIRPDLFKSSTGEVHRVAVTEMKRGAKVFINTDRMNLAARDWVGILVHEVAHHLGVDDDAKRLPDVVGAAVAGHFEAQTVSGDLEEFNHRDVRLSIFNSRAPGRVASAFFAIPTLMADLEMGPTSVQEFCLAGEALESHQVTAPFWRMNRIQYQLGRVSLRAGATNRTVCVDRATKARTQRDIAFVAEVDLNYGGELKPETPWWTLPSTVAPESVVTGPSDSKGEIITRNRAFAIVSIAYEKPVFNAGEVWNAKVVVRSLEGRKPVRCDATLAGARWSFHRFTNLPDWLTADTCRVTELGNSDWQVDIRTTLPANMQPDLFYIPMIRLSEATAHYFALAKRPSYFKIENALAQPRMTVSGWRILGLEPLKTYAGASLPHAFVTDLRKPFWLEVDLAGEQRPVIGYLELKFIVKFAGELVFAPTTIRSDSVDNVVILKSEIVKIDGGSRIRYQLQVPGNIGSHDIRGLAFTRLYAQSDDHAWAEHYTKNVFDGMVLERGSAR